MFWKVVGFLVGVMTFPLRLAFLGPKVVFCRHPEEGLVFVEEATGDHKNVAADLGGCFIHRCGRCGAAVYREEKVENE